jgi:hypothetical protein
VKYPRLRKLQTLIQPRLEFAKAVDRSRARRRPHQIAAALLDRPLAFALATEIGVNLGIGLSGVTWG